MSKKLERATFSTSRLLEFCSERELINVTGRDRAEWPCVVLKELIDNGLDACEEAGVAPKIRVKVDAEGIEHGTPPSANRFTGSVGQGCECPRQESNLVYDLRKVACDPAHSEDVLSVSTPPRSRTPSCGFEDRRAVRHTRRASISSSPSRSRTWSNSFGS